VVGFDHSEYVFAKIDRFKFSLTEYREGSAVIESKKAYSRWRISQNLLSDPFATLRPTCLTARPDGEIIYSSHNLFWIPALKALYGYGISPVENYWPEEIKDLNYGLTEYINRHPSQGGKSITVAGPPQNLKETLEEVPECAASATALDYWYPEN
jgi:hypothetical protein